MRYKTYDASTCIVTLNANLAAVVWQVAQHYIDLGNEPSTRGRALLSSRLLQYEADRDHGS